MSSLIRPLKDTTPILRIRISAELHERVKAVEARTRKAGLKFALSEALSESLEQLLDKAEKELDAKEAGKR